MKIRILGNSIRVRLTKSEVKTLWEKEKIEDETAFVTTKLAYTVQQDVALRQLQVDFQQNCIKISIPKTMADELYHTQKVGFEDHFGPVSILIEKDFVCLDRPIEDQRDHYPNPLMKNC